MSIGTYRHIYETSVTVQRWQRSCITVTEVLHVYWHILAHLQDLCHCPEVTEVLYNGDRGLTCLLAQWQRSYRPLSPCAYRHLSQCACTDMGWLRLVGSLKLDFSFAEYSLCHRAVLRKTPNIWRYWVATTSRLLKIIGLFCKEPYQRDYILRKTPNIWRSLLIVATQYLSTCACVDICHSVLV